MKTLVTTAPTPGREEESPIRIRAINLIILYTEIFCFAAIIFTSGFVSHPGFYATLISYMLFMGALWLFGRIKGKYRYVAAGCVYMTNIVFLPAIFVMSMGMFGGVSMLLVAGHLMAFILLDSWMLLTAVVIIFIWDIFVICFVYYHPEMMLIISDGWNVLVSIIFCFVTAASLAVISLALYSSTYKNLKNSIELSKKHIEDAGKVKSRFLASTTGELRTPMNAILTMIELLERGSLDEGSGFEIATMKTSAFSLLGMINNVLTYSVLDAGRIELSNRQFHFGSMLRDLIYTVSVELANSKVAFFVQVDSNIPDVLYGDESRIRQVFKYILNRCIRNTDDGRICLEVGYEKIPERNSIRISARISDTGWGFTEDEKDAVFNSFEIYDSRKYSNLKMVGLELTICREILALMDGHISIDSIYFVGTAISFDFEIFAAEKTPVVEMTDNTGKNALVYLENPNEGASWLGLLGDFSVTADLAVSRGTLKTFISEKQYDFLFMESSGYEYVRDIIEKRGYEQKCYVISDYRHKFGDFGDCRLIRKPVSALNIGDVLAGLWRSADYLGTVNESSFIAPRAHVLVVDNNMMDLHMVAGLLDRYEISSSIATNGREALDKCARQSFDLILLNQSMPVMDGLQTLEALRRLPDERYSGIPVICMTSTMKYEARADLVKAGFQDLLVKPVKSTPLEGILRTFLPEDLIEERRSDKEGAPAHEEAAQAQDEHASGLNVEKGLIHTGGSLDAYCSILNVYYSEGRSRIDEILSRYTDEDLKLFTINVHAVKGSSAGIGGEEVSELFRRLEMAGKDGDREYILSNLDTAIDRYRELLDEIKEFLEEKGLFEEPVDVSHADEESFDMEEMRKFLEYTENFDTMLMEEMLDSWKNRNFGQERNEYIRELIKACDSFEYDRAAELATEFMEKMG